MNGLPKSVNEFSQYMQVILNRSPKTIAEYEHDLMLFFKYLKAKENGIKPESEEYEQLDISDIDNDFVRAITKEEIYEYFVYTVNVRDNQSRTRARKLSSIKSYFRYMTDKVMVLDENPAVNIDSPKLKQTLPKFLSLNESIELLAAVQNDTESKTRERDYAIITLFLNCGLRLSELVGINLTDVDKNLRSMRVLGKGSKERIIYLNDACRSALEDYLKVRALDQQLKDRNALFISGRHTRISDKMVQKIVYKYLERAGLENRKFSTHKLRHTAATLMYQSGKVDVRVLKDILGHEQLNTTQIYTHVSDASMEAAMQDNPLAEVKIKKKLKIDDSDIDE